MKVKGAVGNTLLAGFKTGWFICMLLAGVVQRVDLRDFICLPGLDAKGAASVV